ncbi:hypothetical protein FRB94_013763 [Tulasnella sp. JGI-2019a]|nr:hypothetical protein FRB94_013763 [Tulasnella sp. JGI-2019a]
MALPSHLFLTHQPLYSLAPYKTILLYIDQPIGAGFSHGAENTVDSNSAATLVWEILQTFLKTFPTDEGGELISFTESHGGHYGPAFVDLFDYQNEVIRYGVIEGEIITVSALMLNKYIISFRFIIWFSLTLYTYSMT